MSGRKAAKTVIQPTRTVSPSPVGSAARAIAGTQPAAPRSRQGRTIKPTSPERVAEILRLLQATYPGVVCALHHHNAWELTVATILSAQCTDARVNMVTTTLFRRFPSPEAMAKASLPEIEDLIRTTGFFRNKAKSIVGAAKLVVADYGGEIPPTMEDMLRIPGVARKTANVVLGSWFAIASGIVVDTHVLRLSSRLELTKEKTPEKVETDLATIVPKDRWIAFSHELIHHGRQICIARKPRCADCTLEKVCNSVEKTWSSH